ncbi:MAG: hypothetical protein S4CHLAM102_12630 [Chlamydiia bacterium]|nr:hypothetical protein [Chlamydiia bacterium]
MQSNEKPAVKPETKKTIPPFKKVFKEKQPDQEPNIPPPPSPMQLIQEVKQFDSAPIKQVEITQLPKVVLSQIRSTQVDGITLSSLTLTQQKTELGQIHIHIEHFDTAPNSYKISIETDHFAAKPMEALTESLQSFLTSQLPNTQLLFAPPSIVPMERSQQKVQTPVKTRRKGEKIGCENSVSHISSGKKG